MLATPGSIVLRYYQITPGRDAPNRELLIESDPTSRSRRSRGSLGYCRSRFVAEIGAN